MPPPGKHNAAQAEYDRTAALVSAGGPVPRFTRGVQAWSPAPSLQ
jgi:hypothetical protein